jgi:hypothetical protein
MVLHRPLSAHAAAVEGFTINFAVAGEAPTYSASGFIYGLSQDGTQPAASLQSGIKTQFLRVGGTQIDCPNGGWVNNDFTPRWNSVLSYYARAQAIGARLILLSHDLWEPMQVPNYPGDNGNWTAYTNFMNLVISDFKANGMTNANGIFGMSLMACSLADGQNLSILLCGNSAFR